MNHLAAVVVASPGDTMALAHHLMLRLADSRVIAPTAGARLELARSVLRIGRDYALLAFRAADTHAHLEAACPARPAAELARRIELSVVRKLRLPVGFEAARIKPVVDQTHLWRLFDYCMKQEAHHGAPLDPLFVASNLPDLLGMRLLGSYSRANLERLLPRITRDHLLGCLGCLELDSIEPALCDLAESAAAAFATADLGGRCRPGLEARRAAVHTMRPRAMLGELADALGLSRRAVRRALAQPPPPHHLAAVRMQMQVRAQRRSAALVNHLPFGNGGQREVADSRGVLTPSVR